MSHSLEDAYQAQKVQQVMSLYCRFVDTKQWDRLAAVLVNDVKLNFQDDSGKVLYAFDAAIPFTEAARDGIAQATTIHHLHNPEINIINTKEASGIWAMEDRFYFPAHAPQPFFHGYGHYHVNFVFINESWRIRELSLTRLRLIVTEPAS